MACNEELLALRLEARLSVTSAAESLDITRQTYRLWESGKIKTPTYVTKLLRASAGFPLCCEWDGWRFINGKLWAPEQTGFLPGDLRSIPYLKAAMNRDKHHVIFAVPSRMAQALVIFHCESPFSWQRSEIHADRRKGQTLVSPPA